MTGITAIHEKRRATKENHINVDARSAFLCRPFINVILPEVSNEASHMIPVLLFAPKLASHDAPLATKAIHDR